MKILENIAFILICVSLLSQCNNIVSSQREDNDIFKNMSVADTINTMEFKIKSGLYGFRNSISLNDSLILFENHSSDTTLFTIYNVHKNEVHCRLGFSGKGKNEFQPPFQLALQKNEKKYLSIFERRNFSFNLLDYDRLISCEIDVVYKVKIEDKLFSQLYPLDSNTILGLGYFEDRFVIIDKHNNKILSNLKYPFHEEVLELFGENYLYYINQGSIGFHPNKKRLIWADRNSRNILICQYSDSEISVIKEIYVDSPRFIKDKNSSFARGEFHPNTKLGFVDFCTSQKGIHFLYSDKLKSEIERGKNFSNYLINMSWDGKIMNKLYLKNSFDKIFCSEDGTDFIFFNSDKENMFYKSSIDIILQK